MPPIPPNNTGPEIDQIDIGRALEESLRAAEQVGQFQGEQKLQLNESISLLKKINEQRDASISKLRSLNAETINLKEIEKELQKSKRMANLADIKFNDLLKNNTEAERQRRIDFANEHIALIQEIKEQELKLSQTKLSADESNRLETIKSEEKEKENRLETIKDLLNENDILNQQALIEEGRLRTTELQISARIQDLDVLKTQYDILNQQALIEKAQLQATESQTTARLQALESLQLQNSGLTEQQLAEKAQLEAIESQTISKLQALEASQHQRDVANQQLLAEQAHLRVIENQTSSSLQNLEILQRQRDEQNRMAVDEQTNLTAELQAYQSLNAVEKANLQLKKDAQKSAEDSLATLYENLHSREENLGVDEAQLLAAMQAQQVANENLDIVNKELDAEKKIKKELGLMGTLLELSNKHLGVGGELHKQLVEDARNGTSATSARIKAQTYLGAAIVATIKLANYFSEKLKGLAGIETGGPISKLIAPVNDLIAKIPIVGGAIAGLLDTFAGILDLTISTTSNIQKMGRELSLSKDESIALNREFSNFANNSKNVLFNSRKLFETQVELSGALGVSNVLSTDILAKNIQMKEIAGIELETRKALTESTIITGKGQGEIVKSVFAQVAGLKQATGINFNNKQILSESAKLGGYLGLQFAKYPAQLAKSLVTVKAMGLELKQMDSIADSFLDFESSIASEFEAQLLTGKEINLNKARELFMNNDLAGAAAEITSQVGDSAEFMKMNRIQAESLARAFGMSRDQMADMLKQQMLLSRLGAKDTDNAERQLEIGLKRYRTHELLSAAIGKEAYDNLMSANAQERIANLIEKIKVGFADLLANSGIMDFIDRAIEFLSQPDSIQNIVNSIKNFFGTVIGVMGTLIGGLMRALNYLPRINISQNTIDLVENAGAMIRDQDLGFLKPNKKRRSEISSIEAEKEVQSTQMKRKPRAETIENNLDQNSVDAVTKNARQITTLSPRMPKEFSVLTEGENDQAFKTNQVEAVPSKEMVSSVAEISTAMANKDARVQFLPMPESKNEVAKNEKDKNIFIKTEFKVGSRDYTDLIQSTISQNQLGKSDGNIIFTA